jgi:lipopolysaccharide transport system permease protein
MSDPRLTERAASGPERRVTAPRVVASQLRWRTMHPSPRWRPRVRLRELWEYRELGLMLALRDIQLRYRQTVFGVGWAILQPLLAMVIFALIFGRLTDIPSDDVPYPVFVLTGLAVWSFLSTAVSAAANSLAEHEELVTKVRLPRMLVPTAAVLAIGPDLVVGLALVAPLLLIYDVSLPLQALTLPVWVAGAVLTALAAGLWLSAANVLYRDVRYAIGFLLQLWFFASPVVYPSSLFEGAEEYILALNPVAGVVDGVRWALLGAPAPGPELAVSAGSLLLTLIGGVFYFAATERRFADRI